MKFSISAFSTLAVLSGVMAQLPELSPCGTTCVQNMQGRAAELDCPGADAACLCNKVDFTYGLRDCGAESCADDLANILAYGVAYCSSAGVAIPTDAETVTSGSVTATPTDDPGSAITTSSFVSTITNDGTTLTTSGATTVFNGGAASSAASSASDAASSAQSSASDAVSSAISSITSGLNDATSSIASAASSATDTSSSTGFAPQVTAGSMGFVAAAGIAAMLL